MLVSLLACGIHRLVHDCVRSICEGRSVFSLCKIGIRLLHSYFASYGTLIMISPKYFHDQTKLVDFGEFSPLRHLVLGL